MGIALCTFTITFIPNSKLYKDLPMVPPFFNNPVVSSTTVGNIHLGGNTVIITRGTINICIHILKLHKKCTKVLVNGDIFAYDGTRVTTGFLILLVVVLLTRHLHLSFLCQADVTLCQLYLYEHRKINS